MTDPSLPGGMEAPNHLKAAAARRAGWPALPAAAWEDSREMLHMWTQIVGKVRLGLMLGGRGDRGSWNTNKGRPSK